MLDTGCTRTCVRKNEKFLVDAKLETGNAKLLCANNEIMESVKQTNMKIQFSGSFIPDVSALVVEKLSLPLIIGLDIIKSLEFKDKSPFVVINNHKLRLVDRFDMTETAYVAELTYLEPLSDNYVPVKNKFFGSTADSIHISNLDRKSKKNFQINSGLFRNEEVINIIVTNKSSRRIKLSKKLPICTLEETHMAENCNAVVEVTDKILEDRKIAEFQSEREIRASEMDFTPEIGSYGDTTNEEELILKELVHKNRLSFSMGQDDLGKMGYFRFALPLIDESQTAHQPPRPIPIHLREKVDEEIVKWQKLGIIQPTQSGFNIPLIILRKPDGSIRISLDARQLNILLRPDRYPLPHMRSVFTRIGERLAKAESCYISSFDWLRGYWQIQMLEEDAHKTSFSYKNRHFEATRMLYGTSTAPSAFARIMNILFGDHPSIILYLDDLIIVDSCFEEHQKSLQFVFDQCQKYGIILNGKKTHLCKSSVEFLGHVINQKGILPLQKHILTVKAYPAPTDKSALKRFLGLVNYNLRYVKEASVILAPLHKICSTKHEFVWGEEQENSFQLFKQKLLNADGLYHRDPSLSLILVSDASKHGSGSTLYQDNNGKMEVIAYSSKKFSAAEERRSMREKELMSLCFAVRANEYFLIGTEFTIVSDHKSLLYLYREHLKTNLDSKLLNIFFYLTNFNFKIVHRPGNSEILSSADAISRLPSSTLQELEEKCGFDIPDKIFTMVSLPDQHEKETDPKMKIFLRSLAKDSEEQNKAEIVEEKPILVFEEYSLNKSKMEELQKDSDYVKNVLKKLELKAKATSKQFALENGILYKTHKDRKKLVVPMTLGAEFLQYTHTAYGHCGSYQLQKIVSKMMFIPKLKELSDNISKTCIDCIRSKPRKGLRPSLIKERHFESIPFQKTSMDLYDLGKPDVRNKRYLVTICDHLTGFCDGIAISNKTDKLVSEAILEMILRYGIGGVMIADNGREFGALTKAVLEKFHIRLVNTCAYQSRSNGKVERCHREITSKLKTMRVNPRNWSENWQFTKFLINNLPKTSLDGLSAAEALFGRPLYVPFETIDTVDDGLEKEPFIKALNEYINEIHPALMNFQYNKYSELLKKDHKGAPILKIGSKALIWKPNISSGKLGVAWSGPFVVIKRLSKDSYLLKDKATHRVYRRSIRHLRPLEINQVEIEKNLNDEVEEETDTTLKENEEFKFNFNNLPFYNC